MKLKIYFNYTSCVIREIEVTDENELYQRLNELRDDITDEEILNDIQENNFDIEEIKK